MRSIDLVRSTKPGGKCGTRSSASGMYIKYCFFPSTATKEIKRKKERKKERKNGSGSPLLYNCRSESRG